MCNIHCLMPIKSQTKYEGSNQKISVFKIDGDSAHRRMNFKAMGSNTMHITKKPYEK